MFQLKTDTANCIITTDDTGAVVPTIFLPLSRGGLGTDFSGIPAGRVVTSTSDFALDGSIGYSTAPTANAFVQRTPDNKLNCGSDCSFTPPPGGWADVIRRTNTVVTWDAATGNLLTFTMPANYNMSSMSVKANILGAYPYGTSALFNFLVKATRFGEVAVSGPLNLFSCIDAALEGVSVSVTSAGNDVLINVTGAGGLQNINWVGSFEISYVEA